MSFLALGLVLASLGPIMLALPKQTGSDTHGVSVVFTARSIGYLLGSTIGGVLLDKWPKRGNLLMSASLFLSAVGTLFIPKIS